MPPRSGYKNMTLKLMRCLARSFDKRSQNHEFYCTNNNIAVELKRLVEYFAV